MESIVGPGWNAGALASLSMANPNEALKAIVEEFAAKILVAVRSMSLGEIVGPQAVSTTAIARVRKAGNVKAKAATAKRGGLVSVDEIVNVLKQHKSGMRSEDLRKALGVPKG